MLRRFSWIIDKRPEVESEELLGLGEAGNRRRWGEAGSGVPIGGCEWSMRLQGLKYDWRMRKSGEGGGRGCLERHRSDLILPGGLVPGVFDWVITISTLWERLCRWKLGVLWIAGEAL